MRIASETIVIAVVALFAMGFACGALTNNWLDNRMGTDYSVVFKQGKIVPPPPPVVKTIHDTITTERIVNLSQAEKDSLLKDCYDQRIQVQTVSNKDIDITITDTTQGNRVAGRSVEYDMHLPATGLPRNKRHFYVGADIAANQALSYHAAAVNALYLDRKGNGFSVGYDVLNGAYQIGYKRKIF